MPGTTAVIGLNTNIRTARMTTLLGEYTLVQAFRDMRREGLADVAAGTLADEELYSEAVFEAELRHQDDKQLSNGHIIALYYDRRTREIEDRYNTEIDALLATDLVGDAYRQAKRPISRRRSSALSRLRKSVGLTGTKTKRAA